MLMLLSVHMTSFLFLVRFALLELHTLTLVAHSYALLVRNAHPILVRNNYLLIACCTFQMLYRHLFTSYPILAL